MMEISDFCLLSVSVFDMKEYMLPYGCKKRKPLYKPCSKGFKNWTSYNKHMQDKHGGQSEWTCNKCSKVLHSLSRFQNHMGMHNEDDKKHPCMKCTRRFTYPSPLDGHIISHGDDRPFKCPSKSCKTQGFKCQTSLNCHMEQHSV